MHSFMSEYRSNRNVVFSCKYHVVWCPKYRRKVLAPPIDERLKQIIRAVCEETAADLVEMEVMPDHVHLFAEPLLRRAASGLAQSASGTGFALPHVRKGVGVDRPSQGDGGCDEAADAVAQARAAESPGDLTLRTLWL